MARINRAEIINQAIKDLRLDPAIDNIPKETGDRIVLTHDVQIPILEYIHRQGTRTTTGSSTLFTTPSDRDFYLDTVVLSLSSNATADNLGGGISVTILGTSREILRIEKLTTTLINETITLSFPEPLKIDSGTNITFGSVFSVGASICGVVITGHTIAL